MAVTAPYLLTTKNLEAFFNAIQSAKAPERFTNRFLTDLDFNSSNDRLFIGMLKALGFIDDSGAPTDRYFAFLDQSSSAIVLADAIREAYGDLFTLNVNAHKLPEAQVKGKLKTLTQGQKSENVLTLMAKTFVALCGLADFDTKTPNALQTEAQLSDDSADELANHRPMSSVGLANDKLQLHYNIQLILPDARDPKVYDALFSSLKKHLLQ
jgi:hypothetical protein